MLKVVIQKEVRAYLLSLRFSICFIAVVMTMIISTVVSIRKYEQRLADYHEQVQANNVTLQMQAQELIEVAYGKQTVVMTPTPLGVMAAGEETALPNAIQLGLFEMDYPEVKSRVNLMLPYSDETDWTFVVALLLSFMAVLLTYDSISGEKEGGSLTLVMSNAVSRDTLLVGKYLGGLIVLVIPLCVGLLGSLLILSLGSDLYVLRLADWGRIGLFMVLSLVYLSVYLFLGFFVSCQTSRSVISITILILIWILLAVLVPSSVSVLVGRLKGVPGREQVAERMKATEADIWARAPKGVGSFDGSRVHDPAYLPHLYARKRLIDEIYATKGRIFEEHLRQMIDQTVLARQVGRLSPTALYRYACEAIAHSGFPHVVRFFSEVKRYQDELQAFVLEQNRQDPQVPVDFLMPPGSGGSLISHKPVDVNNIPKFHEQPMGLGTSVSAVLGDCLGLFVFNIVVFLAAYVRFLRCDLC